MTDPDSSGVAGAGSSATPDNARIEIDLVRDGDEVGQGALEAWRSFEPLEAAVEAAATAVARCDEIDVGWAAAAVALATDARVRELNGAYRGKDKATNVLSFPASSAVVPDQPVFLGDIILAAETVSREAAEQGIEPRHHLQHLVVHGLLHLLGFDHETAAEAEEMEGLETAILATIGIADPYAEPALIEDDR